MWPGQGNLRERGNLAGNPEIDVDRRRGAFDYDNVGLAGTNGLQEPFIAVFLFRHRIDPIDLVAVTLQIAGCISHEKRIWRTTMWIVHSPRPAGPGPHPVPHTFDCGLSTWW